MFTTGHFIGRLLPPLSLAAILGEWSCGLYSGPESVWPPDTPQLVDAPEVTDVGERGQLLGRGING